MTQPDRDLLVKRLREELKYYGTHPWCVWTDRTLLSQAADEIERLRAVVAGLEPLAEAAIAHEQHYRAGTGGVSDLQEAALNYAFSVEQRAEGKG